MTTLTDRLRSHGVVGAGGAGFPTYVKAQATAEIVIVNAAECEPLLHKDKELLHHYQDHVLAGLRSMMDEVGATRGIVAIKEKYVDRIAALEEALAAEDHLTVFALGDFYPAGDEFITIYEATGRVVPPGGLPLDVGCVVTNVETLLNISLAAPVTHKFLTIGGMVPEPVTVRAPVGISYAEVLAAVGVDVSTLGGVLDGGVMMGKLVKDYSTVVTRTTGGLLCFPEGHGLVTRYEVEKPARDIIAKSACDQCSFCTELCPRYLLGHPVEPHLAMRGLEFNMVGDAMILGSSFCCECNLCTLYACPEDLFPKDACADNKVMMKLRGLEHPAKGKPTKPHSMQDYRHVPVSSLMKKLDLLRFQNVGPLVDVRWEPAEVRIPLQQHIGAPAVARVAVGALVRVGDEIGAAPDGLGVAIHASIDGTVTEVGDHIVIRRDQ
ncbi:MAG: 4Fe-4S dicluster domain-containing protein [Planctomycetota bacterium]|nr:4Fe-4S dicluster domain-containing protein [Planctomycetota bacterium]